MAAGDDPRNGGVGGDAGQQPSQGWGTGPDYQYGGQPPQQYPSGQASEPAVSGRRPGWVSAPRSARRSAHRRSVALRSDPTAAAGSTELSELRGGELSATRRPATRRPATRRRRAGGTVRRGPSGWRPARNGDRGGRADRVADRRRGGLRRITVGRADQSLCGGPQRTRPGEPAPVELGRPRTVERPHLGGPRPADLERCRGRRQGPAECGDDQGRQFLRRIHRLGLRAGPQRSGDDQQPRGRGSCPGRAAPGGVRRRYGGAAPASSAAHRRTTSR